MSLTNLALHLARVFMQSSMCWLINKLSFLFIIILSNHYALLGYIKTCMYFIFNSFDNLLMLSVFNNTRFLIVNLLNVFLEIFFRQKGNYLFRILNYCLHIYKFIYQYIYLMCILNTSFMFYFLTYILMNIYGRFSFEFSPLPLRMTVFADIVNNGCSADFACLWIESSPHYNSSFHII